jgi:hypothetical protein
MYVEILFFREITASVQESHVLHCKENPINVFLFWELLGLSPNFHIHVYVSDLYFSQDQSTYFLAAE